MNLTLSKTPTGFDRDFALDVAMPLCQAAYAVMDTPGVPPALPNGYEGIAIITAGEGGMATLARIPGNFHAKMAMEPDIFGLIGKNAATGIAFVSIRGTQTAIDWEHDLEAAFEPYGFVEGAGDVHLGFHSVYKTLRDSIIAGLQEAASDCDRVFVTGHSLGAALAVLAAPDLALNTQKKQIPALLTFAGPRAGMLRFHGFFNHLIPICYRVVASGDVVPQVPFFFPPLLYEHVGAEVKVDGGQDDPIKAHSLELSYTPGLRKLPPAI
jgi:hypothetical protein